MENGELAKYIDHTLLKASATPDDIRRICSEAKTYQTASVCVNSCYASLVRRSLAGSGIKTCCVVGFPLGAMSTAAKAAETECAIADGAEEIDMVQNIGYVKAGQWELVEADIAGVVAAAGNDVPVKVILETCLLTNEEIRRCSEIAKTAGAAFIKTSTGFSTGGATAEDVSLMRATVGAQMGVKASGGIHSREDAETMIRAGATRIGASATAKIIGQ